MPSRLMHRSAGGTERCIRNPDGLERSQRAGLPFCGTQLAISGCARCRARLHRCLCAEHARLPSVFCGGQDQKIRRAMSAVVPVGVSGGRRQATRGDRPSGQVAPLVEQQTADSRVAGSLPTLAAISASPAALVRALSLEWHITSCRRGADEQRPVRRFNESGRLTSRTDGLIFAVRSAPQLKCSCCKAS